MTSPEPPISPRGVPPIRTDWLTDVARRLSLVGLGTLRALPVEARVTLTDVVDGSPWRFSLIKLSSPVATVVELDADLWVPDDPDDRPLLRAGFELAPRWDLERGEEAVRVRTEIGPRGAVTFDPENWIVTVPRSVGAAVASPPGVEPGTWATADGAPLASPGDDASAYRAERVRRNDGAPDGDLDLGVSSRGDLLLHLSDLEPIVDGELVPEVLLTASAMEAGRRRGLRGLLSRSTPDAPPAAVIAVRATGALSVAWTGADPIETVLRGGLRLGSARPVLRGDELTVRTDVGALTVVGDALRVAVD